MQTVLQALSKLLKWKQLITNKVTNYWYEKLSDPAKEKSTLQPLCAVQALSWQYVDLNPHAVDRARLQARLLTYIYTHATKTQGQVVWR